MRKAEPPELYNTSKTKVGFVVVVVHIDGLQDLQGQLFIDENLVENTKRGLRNASLELLEYDFVIASKQELIELIVSLPCQP